MHSPGVPTILKKLREKGEIGDISNLYVCPTAEMAHLFFTGKWVRPEDLDKDDLWIEDDNTEPLIASPTPVVSAVDARPYNATLFFSHMRSYMDRLNKTMLMYSCLLAKVPQINNIFITFLDKLNRKKDGVYVLNHSKILRYRQQNLSGESLFIYKRGNLSSEAVDTNKRTKVVYHTSFHCYEVYENENPEGIISALRDSIATASTHILNLHWIQQTKPYVRHPWAVETKEAPTFEELREVIEKFDCRSIYSSELQSTNFKSIKEMRRIANRDYERFLTMKRIESKDIENLGPGFYKWLILCA